MKTLILSSFVSLSLIFMFAQPVCGQFDVPNSLCINEKFLVASNSNSQVVETHWDFCEGDILLQPTFEQGSISSANIPVGTSLIRANNKWYGFICSLSNNSLIRLEFGASLANTPSITSLGNIGGLLNSPQDIEVVEFESNYYAFVFNRSVNKLIRINLGTDIESLSASADIILPGNGFTNGGVEVEFDGTQWVVAITNSNTVTFVNFGANLASVPSVGDVLTSGAISGIASVAEIKFIKEGDIWYGFATGYDSFTLHKLTFGSSLFTNPTSTPVYTFSFAPYGFDILRDDSKTLIIVSTLQGNLVRLNFGNTINNVPLDANLGNLGGLINMIKIDFAIDQSRWFGLTANWNSKTFYTIKFPQAQCSFSKITSDLSEDVLTYIGVQGEKTISLYERSDNGLINSQSKTVNVTNINAPVIDFSLSSLCENVASTFQVVSGETITSTSWDFGSFGTSTDPNPSILFTKGTQSVKLSAIAASGCSNHIDSQVKIYGFDSNVASFSIPTGQLCTNGKLFFQNNTLDVYDGNLSYSWILDGQEISSNRDLTFVFTNVENKGLTLNASIPGCSDEEIQTVQITDEGPVAAFSIIGSCQGEEVSFTNQSIGDIASYSWDLGEGALVSDVNPTHVYSTNGPYQVTLVVNGTNGCISPQSQQITIYSKPQPDFSLELPPFSCSGSLSQFNDLTPNPVDSNLDSWSWSFGDPLNGTSNIRHAQYLFDQAGTYDVNLEVTTNFGCSASVQKSIVITQSPSTEFSNSAACLNQATTFTPTATADISAWHWRIGSATYDQQSPTHVFSVPSTYTAELTTTSNNGCIAIASKPVTVLTAPVVDFSVTNACAEKATSFTDTSISVDELISWSWNFAGIGSSANQDATFSFPSAGAYPTVLTVSTVSGCNYSVSKGVIIASSPQASFIATPLSGVPPLTVSVTNSSTDIVTQLWSVVGGGSSTQPSAQFTFDQLGEYVIDLTVTDAAGCTDTDSKLISVVVPSLDVELKEIKLVPISDGVFGILVELFNKSNTSVSGLIVNVDLAGVAEVREMIESIIPPNTGLSKLLSSNVVLNERSANYVCAEVVIDGDVNKINNRQCESLNTLTVIRPFPNPASSEINLDWISVDSGNAVISIYNSEGQLVFNNVLDDYQLGLNHFTIPTTSLNPGIYYVLFVGENIRKSFPIVIRK